MSLLRCAVQVAVALLLAACGRSASSDTPPVAEFLVAAGDSTYWVRSTAEGVRVRSAPLLLTQADGHFYEVYVAEDGIDYADAEFGTARVWARDVLGTDSTLLFADSTVLRVAADWKRRHPGETPLDPDDDAMDEDPRTMAAEQIEIVDVHGPWLSMSHLLDIDVDTDAPHLHEGRQTVLDVRTGRAVALPALFGAAEAARITAAGRAALTRLLDSIRAAPDSRAVEARETLASFRFDPASFAITDVARAPAVAFMVPGSGVDGEALALHLPPFAAAPPSWWRAVQPTLPDWAPDSSRVLWQGAGYTVRATPTDDGERLALTLGGATAPSGREWPVTSVAAPAYALVSLAPGTLTAPLRAALAATFDRASALDGLSERAHWKRPGRRSRNAAPAQPARLVGRYR